MLTIAILSVTEINSIIRYINDNSASFKSLKKCMLYQSAEKKTEDEDEALSDGP